MGRPAQNVMLHLGLLADKLPQVKHTLFGCRHFIGSRNASHACQNPESHGPISQSNAMLAWQHLQQAAFLRVLLFCKAGQLGASYNLTKSTILGKQDWACGLAWHVQHQAAVPKMETQRFQRGSRVQTGRADAAGACLASSASSCCCLSSFKRCCSSRKDCT